MRAPGELGFLAADACDIDRPILRDPALQADFEEVGYVVLPFLGAEAVATLVDGYDRLAAELDGSSAPDDYNDTYAEFSIIHSRPEFRRRAYDLITSVLEPVADAPPRRHATVDRELREQAARNRRGPHPSELLGGGRSRAPVGLGVGSARRLRARQRRHVHARRQPPDAPQPPRDVGLPGVQPDRPGPARPQAHPGGGARWRCRDPRRRARPLLAAEPDSRAPPGHPVRDDSPRSPPTVVPAGREPPTTASTSRCGRSTSGTSSSSGTATATSATAPTRTGSSCPRSTSISPCSNSSSTRQLRSPRRGTAVAPDPAARTGGGTVDSAGSPATAPTDEPDPRPTPEPAARQRGLRALISRLSR